MKTFRFSLLNLMLCSLSVCTVKAQEYYEWPDPFDSVTVTTIDTDLYPVSNLIQGPGVGFSEEEPNDAIGGGAEALWVTAADAGFPADYIEQVGQPVIQFDLGEDRTLKEISVWGYSGGNANGTSQFSLRFATAAEGTDDGLFGEVNYGQSITYNPTFDMFLDPVSQQYKLFDEVVVARYVEFTNVDNFFNPPGDGSAPPEPPPERLLPIKPGGDRVGMGEVAFMILPDSFQPGDKIPRAIAGNEFGVFEVGATITGQEFSPTGDPGPGLAQEWFDVANPGSKAALDDAFISNPTIVPVFQAEGTTWWTGTSTALDAAGVPVYPAQVEGPVGVDKGGEAYSVRLTGEILLEESGLYRFKDGVDDYTYLAIDADGSGIAGDTALEVLIDDNAWTSVLGEANGGSPIAELEVDGIAEGGEWRAIEFNMAEGGGGDSAILYWDFSVEDGINGNEDFFPLDASEAIFEEDAGLLLVPDSHLRAATAELIKADASGSLADAYQSDALELQLQVGPNGNDQISLLDLTVGDGVATLDVSGATVRVLAEGTIAEGTEFQIFSADVVTGVEGLNLLFDDASLWNLSGLGTGVLTFGTPATSTCEDLAATRLPGDADGDGEVAFLDFLALANNFGTDAGYEGGDFDCDGEVAFLDFLTLANNFGATAAGTASSVPEPSGLALLGFAGLLIGMLQRRRT